MAFCACVALGIVATSALMPKDTSAQWSDAQSAVVWTQARAALTGRTVTLDRGEVAVSSWGAPVEVAAKGTSSASTAGSRWCTSRVTP